MTKCIFCDNDLNPDTKPEHILLNALGGRKTTRRTICTDHNEIFGSTIDKALTDQVPVIRNLLNLESGTGKPAPALRNITSTDERLNIQGDGRLESAAKPFSIIEQPDGTKQLQVQARSPEHLVDLMPAISAALRISEKRALELLTSGRGAIVSKRPGVIHHQLQFGGCDAVRSMMKSCLELWATQTGGGELKSAPYAPARHFVVAGDADFLSTRTYLDTRPLPQLDHVTSRFGDIFNLIYVRSDAMGRVIGHFTLYNIMAWQMVLAERGGHPDARVGLISNPVEPAVWSDGIADNIDIDFAWLNAPEPPQDYNCARDRIGAMIERHQKRALDREFRNIADSVFKKHGLSELSARIDEETVRLVILEISERVAGHLLGLPHEQPLAPADIESFLRRD